MVTALVAGCAVLCWPGTPSRVVAAGIRRSNGRIGRLLTMRSAALAVVAGRWTTGVILLVASTIWVAAGPAVAISAALSLVTAAGLTRTELRGRRARSDLIDLRATVRMLAREVRSGAQPLSAVTAVAVACRGSSGLMLERLAVMIAADRGGSISPARGAALPETGGGDPASEISRRLAAGWALSARYGVPWVGLVDALATDLDDRVRAGAARAAQVSGPRVSGYVLALMPVLGLLLGAGMGADPVGILFGTGAGHLMLLTGCTLTCAGLWWTARIVRG